MIDVENLPVWPFRGSTCPNCSSQKTWNFHTRHENYFRGNGVEVDKSDYTCFCTTCRHFFVQYSGYGRGEDGPSFLPWTLKSISGTIGESFALFVKTGKVTVDE